MRVVTKHFGFWAGRPMFSGHAPRRDTWSMSIGFLDADRPPNERRYRYWAGVDIQLLPNFIWWQDLLGIENGIMKVHNRIVGIQSWPFMRCCGGRP